jgi:hypothetical protein
VRCIAMKKPLCDTLQEQNLHYHIFIHIYIRITLSIWHHFFLKANATKHSRHLAPHIQTTRLVTRAARARNRSLRTRELAIILVLRPSSRNIRA